jgi:hypothetical protein
MGGHGSGRRSGIGREMVEDCRSIDVNWLHKVGYLVPGRGGPMYWMRDSKSVASISVRAEEDRVVLSYKHRRYEGDWQSVKQFVSIDRVPCRFGGTRPYFLCPGPRFGNRCGRRVVMLFGLGKYFLCRHCYNLAYGSQSEGEIDRALRRASKTKRRLGCAPGMGALLLPKPKGMWARTYERHRKQAIEAQILADETFEIGAAGLLAQIERSESKRRDRR